MKFAPHSYPSLRLLAVAVVSAILAGALLTARAGSVARLFYDGISTTSSSLATRISVATLTNAAIFPDAPSFREQLDDFTALPGSPLRAGLQGKDNSGADYGSYIRGYLEAPVTGDYRFNLASDDNSALYLSSDHLAENRRLIAYELESGAPLFGGPRQEQRLSAPIRLERGRKYYFEVLHKQGGGGSYVQVGWQRPDGVQEIIPALHLAQYPADPFLGTGSLQQPPAFNARGLNAGNLPAGVTNAEGATLVLPLDVIAAQPTTFRWFINDAEVPGENLSFLRFDRTPGALQGAKIKAVVQNAFGSLTSAVTTVTVPADATPPSVLTVETAGNPNLLRVIFSEPVDAAAAGNPANYAVRVAGGTALPVQTVTLLPDAQTVELAGAFGFALGVNYEATIRDVRDRAAAANLLTPNPTVRGFVFSAPTGTTYDFNAGRPAGFSFFGFADVIPSGSHDGSGYLQLTDSFRNRNGAVVLTSRRDVDQVRLRFKLRLGDGGSVSGLDEPGDGFSVNVAADLPLGTLGQPEEGYTPDVPGNRLSVAFDSHPDNVEDPPAITVLVNSLVVTNVPVGTNGLVLNGVPPLHRPDGRWVDVDIDLRRNGLLTLRYDGVTVVDALPTAFEVVGSAQVGLAARTRTWFQTHWVDDLNINFGEGDIGDVGLSPESILGGTFPEGSEVRLAALPTGAGPFRYQWFRDGSPLAGETGRSLRFPAQPGAGGSFSVAVSNAFSGLTSPPQQVVIQPDLSPPAVVGVRGVAGGVNQIVLTFNEPLDPFTATDPATYSSPLFRITDVLLGADGRTVTLKTTAQRVGVNYPLAIAGLRDRAAAGNALDRSLSFVAGLSYRDEVLADSPVRYYPLNEAAGITAFSEVTSGDRFNTNGTYQNFPLLGVPGLVPSDTNETAVQFVRANTNWVAVPNGGDINDFRGPWPKRSYELWFRALSTPTAAPAGANNATIQATTTAGLWEEGGNLRSIAIYLWRDPTKLDPAEAELVFHAYNDTPDGPGAPFGLRQYPATFARATIRTNTTYHVVAVMDGSAEGRDGELRLYLNGELVNRVDGVGQIYNHNGDVQIGRGNSRSHLDISATYGAFDGVIDDVSVYNRVLTEDRIRARYLAGLGTSLAVTNPPTLLQAVDPAGHPNRLTVTFNQPVSPATATNLANYAVETGGGALLPVQQARLLDDLVTVRLDGAFSFQPGAGYRLGVANVADILAADNVVAPTNLAFTFTTAGPAGIGPSSDLAARQVTENDTVRFTVEATGQPPFTYRWTRNGAPLAGATNAALEFAAPLASAGSYSVIVSNEFSGATGGPAVLTVLPDTVAPRLVGLRALAGSLNELRLTFSEPVDPATATSLATYATPTGPALAAATLSPDGRVVILKTAPQVNGQTNQLTIAGLRDRAFTPNLLNAAATFVSGISYRDEVLADGAVRYWTFGEKNGTQFHTLVSRFDTAPENLVGEIVGGALLGLPGLVPNVPEDTAIGFRSGPTNRLAAPNARDLNAILGPWAKRTHLFAFRADHLPRVDGTNVQSPALFAHDRIAFYLHGTQDTKDPAEALLVFRAHNTASEGPGTPWGGTTLDTSKHVLTTVQRGRTYHVAGVLDGSPDFTGQLRLYVDGQPAGAVGGIGQLYKHPNTTPSFGHGSFRTHEGFVQNLDNTTVNYNARFDGVLDEFAILNRALSPARIADLYQFALAAPLGAAVLPEGPADAPVLRAAVTGGNLILSWDGAATLERADSPAGPFNAVPGAVSPAPVPLGGSSQGFFRLRR